MKSPLPLTALPTAKQNSVAIISIVVVCHWVVAISMVFINKSLINTKDVDGDISIFIAWVQNVVGIVTVFIMHLLQISTIISWRPPSFSPSILCHPDMVLASSTFTGTLVFNNLMLKHISVAFYQAARSLTLVFVITFSVFILREKITSKVMLSCLCIISGFYICVDEELITHGVHPIGIFYGIMASIFAALCGVFFQRIQKSKGITSMQLAVNNCVISGIGLTPLVILTSQIDHFFVSPSSSSTATWATLIISGFVSLTMGWISALQISMTSPLTHNISINAKSVFQTVLAVVWNGESRALIWWFGNGLVVTGIATYTANKLQLAQQREIYSIELVIKEPDQLDRSCNLAESTNIRIK